jgi:mono/diheme cytochrome c family protein
MHNAKIKEELDLKDLMKNPIRLFGFSYFYILTMVLGLGIYYVGNLTDMTKNKIMPSLVDSTLAETDLPMVQPSNIPPVDILKVSIPATELIEEGKILYKNNCASCHGDEGKGDGAAGLVMNPKPRDFTANTNWINGRKISEMYKTLDEGILRSGMPSYNYLTAKDRFSIIHYVRTFSKDFPQDSEDELQLLNATYKLSEGKITSAQIPVKVAKRIILDENKSKLEELSKLSELLSKVNSKYENELLEKVCVDKKLVAGFLISDSFLQRSQDELYRIIVQAPLNYGFSPKLTTLSDADWNALYNYLLKLMNQMRS